MITVAQYLSDEMSGACTGCRACAWAKVRPISDRAGFPGGSFARALAWYAQHLFGKANGDGDRSLLCLTCEIAACCGTC